MHTKFTGACLCGAILYSSDTDPVFTGKCHCKDCQRATGSAYTPAMFFPEATVSITGSPSWYGSTADSGNTVERGFLPDLWFPAVQQTACSAGYVGAQGRHAG